MVLFAPLPLDAQGRVGRETGPVLLMVASTPGQWLAGGSIGWRVAPRTRLGGVVAAGTAGGRGALRGEVTGHFLLNPSAIRGASLYGGGGIAVLRGRARGEQMLVVLGLEARPGTRHGWVVEVGLGGGIRVAAGWRWRSMRR